MAGSRSSSRRDFLKTAALAGAGLALSGPAVADSRPREVLDAPPGARVPRKELGTTGETVPILLLGGGAGFDTRYDRILHRAFKAGVNYVDTDLRYAGGLSHRTIGTFARQVGRESIWITSKGHTERGSVSTFTRDLDTCLEELGTDYLDMYQMQAVEELRFLAPEFLRMGERMKASGKIRFFGFSSCGENLAECLQRAARTGGIDAIMFRYSFARYGDLALNRAIDACKRAGIGLIAMKSQNSVPDDHRHVAEFRSQSFTLPQAKLKAIWADDRIDAVVSQIDNTRKLRDNVQAALSTTPLSAGEVRQLRGIAAASAPLACQGCAEICESRIAGPVKVAKPLRFLMYDECYGEPERARGLYDELLPEEKAFDRADLRAATAACPQGIDIAARLRTARERLERGA